jgi:hypothetical protein
MHIRVERTLLSAVLDLAVALDLLNSQASCKEHTQDQGKKNLKKTSKNDSSNGKFIAG